MKKVVINACYGGFCLSEKALEKLGIEYSDDIDRDDPRLVAVVEEMGEEAYDDSDSTELKVVEIPDNCTDYMIRDDDGYESIIYVLDGILYEHFE